MSTGLPRILQAYQLLSQSTEPMTRCEIAAHIGNHEATVHSWLASLHEVGLVRPAGTRRTGRRGLHSILWSTSDAE